MENLSANSETRSNHNQAIVWSLLCLMPIIGMVIDLVAPSLPAIAHDLQASTKMAKNVISIYLLGYALGNFFTGFLTDALGRQKLLRISLFGFVVISLMPLIFPRIETILLVRLLQGMSIGAVAVIIRAIFTDVLPAEKLLRIGTLMGTMWGLGPILGPIIGGYLQFYFGWKASFCFIALLSFIGFIVIFIIIPETHFNRHPLNLKTIKNNFLIVLKHRVFMSLVLLTGITYSLVIVFQTLGPFLIQDTMHYSSVFFGHVALWMGVVFLIATFACRFVIKQYSVRLLYCISINLFFIIALLGLVLSYFFDKDLILILTISACMFFANGFIFPMSMGKGLSFFRDIAGTATATMFLFNILITSLSSFSVSFLKSDSAIPLMWVYLFLMVIAVLIYWGMIHKKIEVSPSDNSMSEGNKVS